MRDQFCSNCGAEFASRDWPRHCEKCQMDFWRNPQPVVVSLVPVRDGKDIGLILIRRGIPPFIGQVALPGGFMEFHETWQDTASRELNEETGVDILPEEFRFFDIKSSSENGKLLIFALAPIKEESEVRKKFKLNSEVTEILTVFDNCELCFPLQTEVLNKWFKIKERWQY